LKRPEQILGTYLKENELTIAFAESMTCGLLAHKLGSVSGTSDFLAGGIVCYSEDVKNNLLKVSKKLIEKHTAESQTVTDALALNLRKIIAADIHAAITGLATDGGTETKSKPVGTVFFSLVYKNKIYKLKKKFNGSPLKIKQKACEEFSRFIIKRLKKLND